HSLFSSWQPEQRPSFSFRTKFHFCTETGKLAFQLASPTPRSSRPCQLKRQALPRLRRANRHRMHHRRLLLQTQTHRRTSNKPRHRTHQHRRQLQVVRIFGSKSLPPQKRPSLRRRHWDRVSHRRRRKIPNNPRRPNPVNRPCRAKRRRSRRIEHRHPEARGSIARRRTKVITTEDQFTRADTTPK